MANSYKMSNGSRVLKTIIDRKVSEAKALKIQDMLDEHGYVFCEDDSNGPICGRNANSGVYIDCSHEISVDQCQKNGESELAWDWQNNIKMRCRPCHQKHDKLK